MGRIPFGFGMSLIVACAGLCFRRYRWRLWHDKLFISHVVGLLESILCKKSYFGHSIVDCRRQMLDHGLTQGIPIILAEVTGPVFGSRCFGDVKRRLAEVRFNRLPVLVALHSFV
jgi:hypothetical protein